MSRFKAFCVLVALVLAQLAVGVGGRAEAGTSLPRGFGGIAVDDLHHHVFVSSPVAGTVTVLDYSGKVVKTISDLPAAGSILIDSTTLYVVLPNEGVIEAYDTTTYLRTGRYGEGALVLPGPLAMAGGKLWTSTGQCEQWRTKLASIDLTPPHAVHVYDDTPMMLTYCIALADVPHGGDQLLAYDDGTSPATTFRFDLGSGAPELAVQQRHDQLGNLRQLAVTPDGQKFVAASGYPREVDEYRMADQLADGVVYATNGAPNAVAVTGAGLVATGRSGYTTTGTDIDVFVLGRPSKRVFSYDFGQPDNTLAERGLAFSGDGHLLFAVNGDSYSQQYQLTVLDLTQPPPPTTTTTTTTTGPSPTTTTTRPGPFPAPPGPGPIDPAAPPGPDTDSTTSGMTTAAAASGGYWLLGSDGAVYPFGSAADHGRETIAAADIEPTPNSAGYWILGRDGRVYGKGDAVARGDATLTRGEHAVSLSATPTGRGYWIFTDLGRVFAFGDAPFRGDMAGVRLNGPVLGSVATPSGRGYWMVSSDGGIFAFGDAAFNGSMGGRRLNRPVMSMAPDPDGTGYWLVASDGGIFAFDAPFYGSTGNLRLNKPISGLVPGRAGYLMVAEDGGIFSFGNVGFHGSLGANPPPQPIVAVALAR